MSHLRVRMVPTSTHEVCNRKICCKYLAVAKRLAYGSDVATWLDTLGVNLYCCVGGLG